MFSELTIFQIHLILRFQGNNTIEKAAKILNVSILTLLQFIDSLALYKGQLITWEDFRNKSPKKLEEFFQDQYYRTWQPQNIALEESQFSIICNAIQQSYSLIQAASILSVNPNELKCFLTKLNYNNNPADYNLVKFLTKHNRVDCNNSKLVTRPIRSYDFKQKDNCSFIPDSHLIFLSLYKIPKNTPMIEEQSYNNFFKTLEVEKTETTQQNVELFNNMCATTNPHHVKYYFPNSSTLFNQQTNFTPYDEVINFLNFSK